MGTFYVGCRVDNHISREKTAKVSRLLVDTGSEFTWISEKTLAKIGVEPEKKDIPFIMANGQSITRTIGFAIIHVNKAFTIDEVVFAQKGDMQLLGARSLEGLNLRVDSRGKKLVAAGPVNAANVSFAS
ncbi:MAG: retroviral-like aspartic protease family protein [Candidatus Scalindua sp.]